MRILLTNARLAQRAGSELATLEFANAYHRRGHEVAIFTLVPGDLGNDYGQQSGVPVLGIADQAALRDFDPELLHVHHWPTALTLEWLGVTAPWIIGFLGRFPPLENPLPLLPGMRVPWWTLNPVGRTHYCEIPGWADSPHTVVGNWFDDHGLARNAVPDRDRLRRLLVVSNHFPESVYSDLESVAAALDIDITRVGLPDKSTVVDADLLRQFDGVVTIGRTAFLAMAVGVPVLVLDHFGADGWVNPDDIANMARHNFSGKWQSLEPTRDRLRQWLADPPSRPSRQEVQDWAFANASLTDVMSRLDALRSEPCTLTPSQVFGAGSLAVGEMLSEFDWIRRTNVHPERGQPAVTNETSSLTVSSMRSDFHSR
jgi:hypothetical protein